MPKKYRDTLLFAKMMEPTQARLYAEKEKLVLEKLLEGVKAFYKNPENEKAYRAWMKTKEAQNYANHINSRSDTGKS